MKQRLPDQSHSNFAFEYLQNFAVHISFEQPKMLFEALDSLRTSSGRPKQHRGIVRGIICSRWRQCEDDMIDL